MKNYEMLKSSI